MSATRPTHLILLNYVIITRNIRSSLKVWTSSVDWLKNLLKIRNDSIDVFYDSRTLQGVNIPLYITIISGSVLQRGRCAFN
jgi:hypothetical protein